MSQRFLLGRSSRCARSLGLVEVESKKLTEEKKDNNQRKPKTHTKNVLLRSKHSTYEREIKTP